MKRGFVYIMASDIRAIYTGVTSNAEARVWQHKNETYEGFSREKGCKTLVFIEEFSSITDAIARERQIKGWNRSKKIAMIESDNPEWNDLAADWYE